MAHEPVQHIREGPPAAHPDPDTLTATRLVALIRMAALGPVDEATDDRVHRLARDLVRDLNGAHRHEIAAVRMEKTWSHLSPYEDFEVGDPDPRGARFGRELQLAAALALLVMALGIGGLLVGDGQGAWVTPFAGGRRGRRVAGLACVAGHMMCSR